jgi:hypothetical protein
MLHKDLGGGNMRLLIILLALIPSLVWGQSGCYPLTVNENNEMELTSTINGEEVSTLLTFNNIYSLVTKDVADDLDQEILVDKHTKIANLVGGEPESRQYIRELNVKFLGTDTLFEEVTVVDRVEGERLFEVSLLFFQDMQIQFNFPGGQFCVSDPAKSNLDELHNIDLEVAGHWQQPAVKARLNDEKDVWLILSPEKLTGVFVDQEVASDLSLQPPEDADSGDLTYFAMLDSLEIGPYTLGNVSARIPMPDQETRMSNELRHVGGERSVRAVPSNGFLGMDVLKHFVLTIDLTNKNMHIYAP